MKYRQLGRWGVRLSEIGMGSWLTMGHGIDKKTAKDLGVGDQIRNRTVGGRMHFGEVDHPRDYCG